MKRNYFLGTVSSCLMHGIIIFLMFINIQSLLNKTYGNAPASHIQTYLYQSPSTPFKTQQKKSETTISTQTIKVTITSKPTQQKTIATKVHIKSNSNQPQILSHGGNASQLLQLLHQAIQAKQQYPQTALLLKQQGMVRIGFQLSPDGNMQNIRIIHSSGIKDLDEAAILAVMAANPVKDVGIYLQKPKDFYINLIYQS